MRGTNPLFGPARHGRDDSISEEHETWSAARARLIEVLEGQRGDEIAAITSHSRGIDVDVLAYRRRFSMTVTPFEQAPDPQSITAGSLDSSGLGALETLKSMFYESGFDITTYPRHGTFTFEYDGRQWQVEVRDIGPSHVIMGFQYTRLPDKSA